MNREKMSKFIADYLQNDKTTFAMMMSGEWGTGKSFYIKGELSKEIKNNGNELMVISLYGMSNLQELSQRICYERNHTSLNAVKAIKATAKTIINYSPLPQIFWNGVGWVANKIKKQIDKSIDLTGILLVLEDVERTKIDLEDFFGYVNNLCEQDGVKVLLVTDEEKVREKLDNYDKIKDKVVGDTIHFEPDLKATLRNIFDIYGFNDVCDLDADMSDIRTILHDRPNFRKVIYACQKVHEIFNCEEFADYKDDAKYKQFRKNIFLSTLLNVHEGYYSKSQENKEVTKYDEFPLPKFVYNYLTKQQIDKDEISIGEKEYKEFVMYKEDFSSLPAFNSIPAFYSIKNHYIISGKEIEKSLDEISTFISDTNNIINIPLLFSLIETLAMIDCRCTKPKKIDTESCKNKILKRLVLEAKNNKRIYEETIEIKKHPQIKEVDGYWQNTISELMNMLNEQRTPLFDECNENIKDFFLKLKFSRSDDIFEDEMRSFINKVSPPKMLEYIIDLNDDIDTINTIIYSFNRYITKNKEWFKELKDELNKNLNGFKDQAVNYHIRDFIKEIEKHEKYIWKNQDTGINTNQISEEK